ncbi:MAG: NmrA family NAD(P)-binding protein [Pseudomonadota bacterium]
MASKKFAVLGATGQIGRVLSEELLRNGHKVRAIGRDAKKLDALRAKGAEIFSTGFENEVLLSEAFFGSDGVFVMLPPGYGVDDLGAYQDRTGETIRKAIETSKVKKVVNLSSVGAHHPDKTGPIKGAYAQEHRLNALPGTDVLHLRPAFFMQNFLFSIPAIKSKGAIASPIKADLPFWAVSTNDIGKKASEFLGGLGFKGKTVFEFVGPRQITYAKATQILGKAIGKEDLKYEQLSYADQEKGMIGAGMKPGVAKLMVEMHQATNDGLIIPTQTLKEDHKGATTFESFAREFAEAFGK